MREPARDRADGATGVGRSSGGSGRRRLRDDVRRGRPLQHAAGGQLHGEHPRQSRWARPSREIRDAIAPRGRAAARCQRVASAARCRAFEETLSGLRTGCCSSVVVIFLLLAANFQSFRLALAVISPVPAVICGVLLMLAAHAHHAERAVVHGRDHGDRRSRSRTPFCWSRSPKPRDGRARPSTTRSGGGARPAAGHPDDALAMIAGMIPMALEPETRAQTAPLGRAVIGGLVLRHRCHAGRAARCVHARATAREDRLTNPGSR